MFELIGYILLGLVGLVVLGAIFSKEFRQNLFLRLRLSGNAATKAGTTASERNRQRMRDLIAKLPEQRRAVARVMSDVDSKQRTLDGKVKERDGLLTEYENAKKLGGSATALEDIKTQWKAAKDSVPTLQGLLEEAHKNAEAAQGNLQSTVSELKAMESQIDTQAAKEELAKSYKLSAETRENLNSIKSGLSDMAQDFKETDKELDEARNLDKLSQGTDAEREREELKRKATATSADDEIEAALASKNGSTPPATK